MKRGREQQLSLWRPLTALMAAFVIAAIPAAGAATARAAAAPCVPREVELGGSAFGVKIYADGVMVVGVSDIETPEGLQSPAYEAGIRVKDVITAIDGSPLSTVEQLSGILESGAGAPVTLTVRRGDQCFDTAVHPVRQTGGAYRAGMWVRDSTAGIGTLTFYDPVSGVFGGLGHAICDVDTGEIVPIDKGSVVNARIIDVRRGQKGAAGELVGIFDSSSDIGSLFANGRTGVFGVSTEGWDIGGQLIPVGTRGEVHTGPAQIVCSASGLPERYDIEITKVMHGAVDGKSMCIKTTDPRLIELTGGIVQGMSGSPIIQDGLLIGAITHVLLSDPERGYGIFIESMLETATSHINAAPPPSQAA